MGGYTKNIAVVRTLKAGFSADGGQLSGIVKAEKYGGKLKAEATLINFAPLSEGRYVIALSDGRETVVFGEEGFEGASALDTCAGFAALICFVKGGVSPVAYAVCGSFHGETLRLKEAVERSEGIVRSPAPVPSSAMQKYEDEAIAQENYYEYGDAAEEGGALREGKEKEEHGHIAHEDEDAVGAVPRTDGLAHGRAFYEQVKEEAERVFSTYPAEQALQRAVENSRWARIDYGEGKSYVFGVIYGGGQAQYICYGVPAKDSKTPPPSLRGLATFLPVGDGGYWVAYQDAGTGASVRISD